MPKTQKRRPFLMTFIVSCAVISNHNNGVGKVLVIYPPYRFSSPVLYFWVTHH